MQANKPTSHCFVSAKLDVSPLVILQRQGILQDLSGKNNLFAIASDFTRIRSIDRHIEQGVCREVLFGPECFSSRGFRLAINAYACDDLCRIHHKVAEVVVWQDDE